MTQKLLFTEVALEWLQSTKYVCKESTYFKYFHLYETHLCDYFKDKFANEITEKDIVSFLSHLKTNGKRDGSGGLSKSSINAMKYLLQAVIDYGADKEYMKKINFKFRVEQDKYNEVGVLSNEDIIKLEKYLLNNLNISNLGILLCLYTGLRIGEICALQWKDISIEDSYLIVNKTVQRLPISTENKKTHLIINSPKSRTSFRKVPIPNFLCTLLSNFKPKDKNQFLLTESNVPLDPRTYQLRYKKIMKKADIPYINFHALRHTFATRCIQANIDAKTVSEILGHSNVHITMDIYVFSSFDFKKQQIEKLCLNNCANT